MPSLQRLPVELLDQVLKAVANSATLGTAILSYKRFYIIYKAHPEIIHRCVLENSLGSEVLDAALRSIRIPAWMPTCLHTNMQDIFEIIRTDFHEDKMVKQRITDAEYSVLFDRARICDELEVVYSRWYKDRFTDRKSLLSPAERKSFRISIYRLWLLSSFVGKDSIVREALRDLAVRQQLFYDSYSSQDVYNQHSVVGWMVELVDECLTPTEYTFSEFTRMKCIVGGPDAVHAIYDTPEQACAILQHIEGLVDADHRGWKDDIRHIFQDRKLLSPSAPEGALPSEIMPLVVLPEASILECSHCRTRRGVRLWNETNWEHIPRHYRLETLSEWFKGDLKYNFHERLLLLHFFGIPDSYEFLKDKHRQAHADAKALLKPAPDEVTIPHLLRTLCDLPWLVDKDEHVAYLEKNEFTAGDLLCKRCLREMVEARLWLWWNVVKELSFNELSAPDQATSKDCWFGHDCRSQSSDPDHVFRFNHVCPYKRREHKRRDLEERRKKREERKTLAEATRASGECDHSADGGGHGGGALSTDKDKYHAALTPVFSTPTLMRRRHSL